MKKTLLILLIAAIMLCTAAFAEESVMTAENGIAEKYTFTLDGVSYSLPCAVADLTANGWQPIYEEMADSEMAGWSLTMETLEKGDALIYLQLMNASSSVRTEKECTVVAISVDDACTVPFVAAGNIEIGMDANAAIEALGADSGIDMDSEIISCTFQPAEGTGDSESRMLGEITIGENRMDLIFNGALNENAKISSIDLVYYMTTPADEENGNVITDELPELCGSYAAPAEPGDISSFNYTVNGKTYAFPTPASELAGVFNIPEDSIVPGMNTLVYEGLGSDENWCACSVTDPFKDAIPALHGCVDWMLIETADFELPGGVKIGMTEEELLAAVPVLAELVDDSLVVNGIRYTRIASDPSSGYNSVTYDIADDNETQYRSISIILDDNIVTDIAMQTNDMYL